MTQHDGGLPQVRACPPSREHDLDASEEVEVMKAILQREGYMDRARSQIASPGSQNLGALDDLITTLDLLRSATLDTVEATAQWRRTQGHTDPFIWGGMNYLLKIPTDLNFLDEHKVLRSWMGFSLRRNPFVISVSLERLADIPGEELRCRERVFPMDKKGFTDVGGVSQRLLPTVARNSPKPEWRNSTSPSFRARSSVIADSDMMRIRAAAAIIAHEEAVCGRFTVDGSGRCVPVDVAENCMYSHVLGLDDYIETNTPSNLPPKLAPFTDLAEVGRVPDSKGTAAASACAAFGDSTALAGNRREPSRGTIRTSVSGKANAQRVGGKLIPVAVNTASPRKTKPVTRSVGAMLRAEMMHRKQQNKWLQQELESLRYKLVAVQAQSLVNERQQEPKRPHAGDHTILYPHNSREHLFDVPMENVGDEALTMKRKSEDLERRVRQQVALEDKYHEFRANEVRVQNKTRALVLERKRRLLEQDPDGFQTTDDDEYTLEEQAATQVQRITRGMQGRTRVRNLRPLLYNAASKIQGIMRGHLGRVYAEVKRKDEFAVTNIQRIWRGTVGRSIFKSNRSKLERHIGARDIQRILRGRIGRQRVGHKKGLRDSAMRGAAVVGVKQLFHQDIVELADAIDTLCERGKTPPPSIVLGLLKLVALMLEQDEESGAITSYSTLRVQSVDKLEPSRQFSWRDAVRLLRRSSKLLRRLRQVAAGPASKRPRVVYFMQTAVLTYRALRCDHEWNVTTLGRIGAGAKACQHLMLWVDALQEVFAYQHEFANDLGSDRMPWVARAQQSLSCMRHLELSRMVWEHAVACLQKVLSESYGGSPKQGVLSCNTDGRRGDLRKCVAESALEMSNDRETCARDALCRMRQEEEQAQGLDLVREEFNMGVLSDDLNNAEADLTEAYTCLEAVKRAVRDGVHTHQEHLQLCLDDLTTAEIVRRERWTSFEMFRTQMKRDTKRRGVDVEVWGNLRHEVRVVGEMEAASVLAAQNLRFFRCDSKPDESEGSCTHESKALQRGADEAQSLATAAWIRLDLLEEEKEHAYATANEAELQSEEAALLHDWDEPTEEEREEDLGEDERCARREAEAAAQFVPSTMLVRPFKRPRPVIICLSRDAPAAAKENIVRRLESDLPGMTVHIDVENNMGLHVENLQQALSVRFSVICNVDTGVGARCRSAFLQRLASVKNVLIPTPNFVLVMGDDNNRSGGPLDSSVGCSGRDLAAMKDGYMKKCLEDTARIIRELQHPICLGAIADMGRQVIPPSYSHTLVMEALIILLTPKKVFHNHVPLSSMRGVTWTEARHMLGLPDKLWTSMARVDSCNIPIENISTLQAYIDHDNWPHKRGAPSGDANILDSLAAWAYSTVESSVLLEKSGGCPPALCRHSTSSAGLLAAVVPVHDECFDRQQRDKAQCTRGWIAAYHQTLSVVLEDVRVFRVAQFVRGARPGSVHLIEVYQECGRLFFRAYDPESCVSNFFVLEERKVSHLLAPSLDEPPEPGSTAVPRDRQDIFGRLVALLSFETVASDTAAGKRLTCQRRLRRLLRDTRHISGHLVQVTVCEEAKGELRYNVYLADHSARIQLKVDARALEHMVSDSDIATGEREDVTSEDTSCLLGPITDRLVISPSRTTMATMGARNGVGMMKPLVPSQGFVLKVRRKGGPGRLMLRTVCLISGASHVLTGWELGKRGLLRLAAYNPTTSMTHGVRLSKIERACFGYDTENCKVWSKDLVRRLSLRRVNAHTVDKDNIEHPPARRTMALDKTVISTACRVAVGRMDSRLFRMRVSLVDSGRSVALDLYEDRTCQQCHMLLTIDDLAEMGVWSCEVQAEQQSFIRDGSTTVDASVEQECLITRTFGSTQYKEAAVRRLTRQLRFTPDTNSVTLPVNGGIRTAAMITSENVENRRPQHSLRVERLQTADTSLSHAVGRCGYRDVFCQQRHQPAALIHGDKSSRKQHSRPVQDAEGKKKNNYVARESPKRKKGKNKRGKTDAKPLRGDDKVDADALEVGNRNELSIGTTKLARKKEGAVRHPQEAFIDDNVDTIRFIGGTAPICALRSGERQVFKEAVSMRIGDWEEHQPMCDTVITVYESPSCGTGVVEHFADNDGDFNLRVVVFYAKMAAYSEVSIKGFMDLRQVVGPLHQSLVLEWKHSQRGDETARALFNFIFHSRAIIIAGTWDGNLDEYVEHGTDFTAILKRSRFYRSTKQTPIHRCGDEDAQANAEQLIGNPSRRGRKVFRRTVNVSSVLFQVTAYELPPSDTSLGVAPILKFVAYDPKGHTQLVTVVPAVAVLELGGGPHSPWMSSDKREVLAEILAHALRLKTAHDGSSTLVIPWSGENLSFMDEVQVGETSRPRRDKVLACAKRKGLARLEVFSTRITGYEVVVTVFAEIDARLSTQAMKAQDEEGDRQTLTFNVYCPKLSKSADVDLHYAMQKMMTGDRVRVVYGEGQRHFGGSILCPLSGQLERCVISFLFKPHKPWLVTYNELDEDDRPSLQRPRGQPHIFIPGEAEGDIIISKGVTIHGLKVLLCVHTKEKGRPGREGLVWKTYNQETCATSILHMSASNLLEHVDNKDHLCQETRLLETINKLTKRLVLRKAAAGGWDLHLDRKLEPWLFGGL